MSLATYATSRTVIASALDAALTDWEVHDHPPDAITHQTIALAPQLSQRANTGRWRRDITVACFVARSPVATALSALDSAVPTVVQTLFGIDGVIVDEVMEPRAVTIADVDYLTQLIPIVIETNP